MSIGTSATSSEPDLFGAIDSVRLLLDEMYPPAAAERLGYRGVDAVADALAELAPAVPPGLGEVSFQSWLQPVAQKP